MFDYRQGNGFVFLSLDVHTGSEVRPDLYSANTGGASLTGGKSSGT